MLEAVERDGIVSVTRDPAFWSDSLQRYCIAVVLHTAKRRHHLFPPAGCVSAVITHVQLHLKRREELCVIPYHLYVEDYLPGEVMRGYLDAQAYSPSIVAVMMHQAAKVAKKTVIELDAAKVLTEKGLECVRLAQVESFKDLLRLGPPGFVNGSQAEYMRNKAAHLWARTLPIPSAAKEAGVTPFNFFKYFLR